MSNDCLKSTKMAIIKYYKCDKIYQNEQVQVMVNNDMRPWNVQKCRICHEHCQKYAKLASLLSWA